MRILIKIGSALISKNHKIDYSWRDRRCNSRHSLLYDVKSHIQTKT